ncbi:MAG: hypothetical protein GXP27_22725, partial [Planctomycetes bacterium]|nr:hypothetical protein [Planctomycetota bacterium]
MRAISALLLVTASGWMTGALVGCRSPWPRRSPHYQSYGQQSYSQPYTAVAAPPAAPALAPAS